MPVTKFFLILTLLITLAMPQIARAESYDPTLDLIAAFEGGCQSVGRFTMGAVNQTSSLRNIIESMKKDPTCDQVQGALDGVVTSSDQMSALLSPSYSGWL